MGQMVAVNTIFIPVKDHKNVFRSQRGTQFSTWASNWSLQSSPPVALGIVASFWGQLFHYRQEDGGCGFFRADDSGDITEPIRVDWAFGNEFCQVHWQVNISRLSSHPISNYGWNSWSEAELKHRQQPMTYCNVGASVAGLVAEPEIFLCHRRSTLTKSTGYGCSLNEQNRNSQIGSNNCSAILVKTLISTQHDCALKS